MRIVFLVIALLIIWVPVFFNQMKLYLLPNFFRNITRIIAAIFAVLVFKGVVVDYVLGIICEKFKVPYEMFEMTEEDFGQAKTLFFIFGALLAIGLVLQLGCIIKKPVLSTWYGEDDEELPYPNRCGISCAATSIWCSVILLAAFFICFGIARSEFVLLLDGLSTQAKSMDLYDMINTNKSTALKDIVFYLFISDPSSASKEFANNLMSSSKDLLPEIEVLIADSVVKMVNAGVTFVLLVLLFFLYSRSLAIASLFKLREVGGCSTATMILSIVGVLISLINITTLIGVITSFKTHRAPVPSQTQTRSQPLPQQA